MSQKEFFSFEKLDVAADNLYDQIMDANIKLDAIYYVPNGGLALAMLLSAKLGLPVVSKIIPRTLIVDDIVDSGKTLQNLLDAAGMYQADLHFAAIHVKDHSLFNPDFKYQMIQSGVWVEYAWEVAKGETGIEDHITRILEYIGDDPTREGLLETPKRVVKSWNDLYCGYKDDAAIHLSKIFSSDSDEMVIVKDIEFYSTCEHHMLPIIGKAHVAYIPGGKVVGLSKIARVVEVFARRLQIQEQMTEQIATSMMKHIAGCKGVGVVIEAEHLCMSSRGIKKQRSTTTTSALKGVFTERDTRAEFLSLIKG